MRVNAHIVNFLFLALIGWVMTAVAPAQTMGERYAPLGSAFIESLATSPFPHAGRAAGHTYQGRLFPALKHYADSCVAFFVLNDF